MRILSIFGTRPEAIKMAPVVTALARTPGLESRICVTAQHRQMLDQVLELYGITPHHDLDVMQANQTLPALTAKLLERLDGVLASESPDAILVQGDTTSAFVGALAGFYRKIAVGHVEAGLRTYDLAQPWPEEMNRQVVSRLASWHFAPTSMARDNLLAENVPDDRILVTGNTVVDALVQTVAHMDTRRDLVKPIEDRFADVGRDRRLLLVTAHRRESFGAPMEGICRAIARLAARGDVDVVFPVHPNPAVRTAVESVLRGLSPVRLIDPLDYLSFVFLMNRSYLILTDSGGVQEEAPSLGKPVLVMRALTERLEAVNAGTVKLVGTDEDTIVAQATRLLDDRAAYLAMSRIGNPYGDGQASGRIAAFLQAKPGSLWT
jgi:UDP-N-acetylglucosamine 2-epimerase (non-hydrolysing)